ALLTFSGDAWYPAYGAATASWNIGLLTDQRTGALVMWMTSNGVFLALIAMLFVRWFAAEERRADHYGLRSRQLPPTLRCGSGMFLECGSGPPGSAKRCRQPLVRVHTKPPPGPSMVWFIAPRNLSSKEKSDALDRIGSIEKHTSNLARSRCH